MLAKLLQGNSVFLKISFFIVFVALFVVLHQPFGASYVGYFAVFLYLLNAGVLIWFLHHSSVVKQNLVPVFLLLIWLVTFGNNATDLSFSASVLLVNTLVLALLDLENTHQTSAAIFNLGILLFIACLAYVLNVFLAGFVVVCLLLNKNIYHKSIGVFLLGFIMLALVAGQLLFLTDSLSGVHDYIANQFYFNSVKLNPKIVSFFPIVALVMISVVDFYKRFLNRLSANKQTYFVLLMFCLNYSIIYFLFYNNQMAFLAHLSLPVGVFIGRFIQYRKNVLLKDVIMLIYLACFVLYWVQMLNLDVG